MACPFFEPRTKLGEGPWDPAPRLPLVEAWAGVCVSPGFTLQEPDESEQREICNTGYARGRCPRFPSEAEADAVRFSAVRDGEALRVVFVLEKDHAPVRHGLIIFSEGKFTGDPLESPLREQARAFVLTWGGQSCLRAGQ
jgi:hypothetical protein